MNSMWWPPNISLGAFVNQAIFLMLSSLATFNYVMATITGPGLLPLKWQPQVSWRSEHECSTLHKNNLLYLVIFVGISYEEKVVAN